RRQHRQQAHHQRRLYRELQPPHLRLYRQQPHHQQPRHRKQQHPHLR
ncbi:unnamed protein product, partial [Rotaria sp. Silwood2]